MKTNRKQNNKRKKANNNMPKTNVKPHKKIHQKPTQTNKKQMNNKIQTPPTGPGRTTTTASGVKWCMPEAKGWIVFTPVEYPIPRLSRTGRRR
jgi:hypothetical protein